MNDKSKEKLLTREERDKAAEIARMITLLPASEQEKIFYMLKGSEIFGKGAFANAPHAAAV